MLPASACKRCGGVEDEIHVLLSCPFAQRTWNQAQITRPPSPSSILSPQALLEFTAVESPSPSLALEGFPFNPWILWHLWKARNLLVYENRFLSEQDVLDRAVRDATQWKQAKVSVPLPASCQKAQSPAPPPVPSPFPECYVDAAWNPRSGNCGMGWITKGSNTHSLFSGCSKRPLVSSALMGEALGLKMAMSAAVDANQKEICFLSDSQSLIKMINTRSATNELYGVLHDIWMLQNKFDRVCFSYISRSFNVEAEKLAKCALLQLNSSPCTE